METRDRLIELIYCSGRNYDDYVDEQHEMGMSAHEDFDSWLADDLLANGVIVPPCKVGDMVYVVDYTRLGKTIFECRVDEISHYSYGTFYYLNWGLHIPRFKACKEDSFGKTVFLTKEEAEKALKEREDNG